MKKQNENDLVTTKTLFHEGMIQYLVIVLYIPVNVPGFEKYFFASLTSEI